MKHLQLIKEIDGIKYLLYRPSLFKLYYSCYTREDKPPYFSRFVHRIRMIRELLKSNYKVIYLLCNNEIVGHLVFSKGGSRIAMSTKRDIVIGPIWVVPHKRSCGYASKGINFILNEMELDYHYAYEYIEKDNIPSIRTVEKNGFCFVGKCSEFGLLKTIRPCSNGHLNLYRIKNINF